MAQIFISYSRADAATVESLIEDLDRMGFTYWYDQNAHGGQQWWNEITRNIAEAALFVQIVTPDSLKSVACQTEIRYAHELGLEILPISDQELDANLLPPPLLSLNLHRTTFPTDKLKYARLQDETNRLIAISAQKERRPDVTPPPLPLTKEQQIRIRIDADDLDEDQQKILISDIRLFAASTEHKDRVSEILRRWRDNPTVLGFIRDEIDHLLAQLDDGRSKIQEKPRRNWPTGLKWVPLAFIIAVGAYVPLFEDLAVSATFATLLPFLAMYVTARGDSVGPLLLTGLALVWTIQLTDTFTFGFGVPLVVIAAMLSWRLAKYGFANPREQKPLSFALVLLIVFGAAFQLSLLLQDYISLTVGGTALVQALAGLLVFFGLASLRDALIATTALAVGLWALDSAVVVEVGSHYFGLGEIPISQFATLVCVLICAALSGAVLRGERTPPKYAYAILVVFSVFLMPGLDWPGDMFAKLTYAFDFNAHAQEVLEEIKVQGTRRATPTGSFVSLVFLIIAAGVLGSRRPMIAAAAALLPIWILEWLYQLGRGLESQGPYSASLIIIPLGTAVSVLVGTKIMARVAKAPSSG